MTILSWACTSASGPGRTGVPWSMRSCSSAFGTCSCSNVSTAAGTRPSSGAMSARIAASSLATPTGASVTTCAADDAGSSTSTRRPTPSSAAAGAIMRASWPPPTTATTGAAVAGLAEAEVGPVTGIEDTGRRSRPSAPGRTSQSP